MKKLTLFSAFFIIIFSLFLFPHSILAATPTLSLTTYNNNSIQISVNGDSNSSVNLYYYPSGGSLTSAGNIGSTNSSGYFSTIVNNGTYNIPSGSNTYVTVNGQQSNMVSWPYNNGNGGQITFSQNNINLNYGQSITVTIYGGSSSYYISSNSNPNSVNASINGNQLFLSPVNNQYGTGSATLTICSSNSNSSCGSLYVNVGSNYYNNNNNYYNPGYTNNNGCYYSNGYYNCPNNTNPTVYVQNPTTYQSPYGTPSAGILLSQVPVTGVSFNLKVALFFIGLFLWSAFGASMILAHRKYQKLLSEKADF